MATSQTAGDRTRTVGVNLEVNTLGAEEITKLGAQIKGLAKDGGDAAPEFERLGNEIQKLGQQQAAVTTLQGLQAAVASIGPTYDNAAKQAAELGEQLQLQNEKTKAARDIQQAEAATLKSLTDALANMKTQLKLANLETDDTVKKTDAFKASQTDLQVAIVKQGQAIREQKDALASANVELKAQSNAQDELSAKFDKATKTAASFNTTLDKRNQAFADAAVEAEKLGVSTENLDAEQIRLVTELNATSAAAVELQTDIANLARSNAILAEQEAQARTEMAQTLADYDQYQIVLKATQAAQLELLKTENNVAEATQQLNAIYKDFFATQEAELAASIKLEASRREMAEADRLLAIEQAAMNDLLAKGRDALSAENVALNDAAQQANLYAAAQRKIADAAQAEQTALIATTKAAKDASAALAAAFSATGTRGSAAIEAEIADINAALVTLSRNAQVTNQDFAQAFVGAQQKIAGLRGELQGVAPAAQTAGSGIEYLKGQFAQLAAIYSGFELARKFVEANVQMQTLTRTLTNITGSTQGAVDAINVLQNAANKNGLAVSGLVDDFVRFRASMEQTKIPLSVTNQLFTGITDAAGTMGLTTERAGLVLNALGQIASKGTVQMEELKGQIGDSLPGALNIAAKSMQLTTGDLTKLIESGGLFAEDFLPAFAKALPDAFKKADTGTVGLAQSFNVLSNAFTKFFQQAADSSALQAIAKGMLVLADNVDVVVRGIGALATAFISIKAVAIADEFLGVSKSLDLAQAAASRGTVAVTANTTATALNAAEQANVSRAVAVETDVIATNTRTITLNTGARELNVAASTTMEAQIGRTAVGVGTATSKFAGLATGLLSTGNLLAVGAGLALTFGDKVGEMAAKVVLGGDALAKNTAILKAQDDAYNAAQQARQKATEGDVAQFSKLNLAITDSNKQTAVAVDVAKKHSDAVKIQAQTVTQLAAVTGDELHTRTAAVDATKLELVASQQLTAARQLEVDGEEKGLKALLDSVGGYNNLEGAKKKSVDATIAKIAKDKEELEQSSNTTKQLQQELTIREAQLKTVGLQTTSLKDSISAYGDAKAAVEALKKMQADGIDVTTALTTANTKLAAAYVLLKDNISDSTKQTQIAIQALKDKANAQKLDSQLLQETLKTQQMKATADGQSYLATVKQIDAIKENINQQNLDIASRKAILDVQQQQINKDIDAAKALDNYTPEVQALIQARQNDITAQQKQIEISKQQVLQEEQHQHAIEATIGLYNAMAGSIGGVTDKYAAFTQAAIKANNAANLSVLGKTGQNTAGQDVLADTGSYSVPDGYYFDQAQFNRDKAANPYGTLDYQKYVKPIVNMATGPYSGSLGFSTNPTTGQLQGNNGGTGQTVTTGPTGVTGTSTGTTTTTATPSSTGTTATAQSVTLNVQVGNSTASFTGSQADANILTQALAAAQRSAGYA